MSNLPASWSQTKFTDILDVHGGTQPPKSEFIFETKDGYIRLLQIRDFGGKPVPTYIPVNGKWRTCSKKDILIGRYGASLGRICTGMEGAYNVALAKVVGPKQIDSVFLKYFLRSNNFQDPLRLLSRSAQNGFNKRDLAEFDLLIPPEHEQIRIANKLDSLLAKVDAAQARLEKIPTLLKRFRQSVLAAATSGELTREWREENNESFEAWKAIQFSGLTTSIRSGSGDKPSDNPEGIPVLRSSAVRDMKIDFTDVRFFENTKEVNARNNLENGDLLFTRLSGSPDYVGNCAVVSGITDKVVQYPDRLFCAKVKDQRTTSYLEIFFSSKQFKSHISRNIKSSAGHQRITLDPIKNAEVNIPTLEEQKEIVRRVESLFALANAVEKQYREAKQRTDRLTQSLLAKAFRGELVPQDPNDEPAAELLNRIQANREAQQPVKPVRKTKRAAK